MGSAWNEMMPQTKRTSAPPSTRSGFASAKSIALRIMLWSRPFLCDIGGEFESISYHFVAWFHSLADLLHAVGVEAVRIDRDPPELIWSFLAENPVFIVKSHDGG